MFELVKRKGDISAFFNVFKRLGSLPRKLD